MFYGDGSKWAAKTTESSGDAQIQRTFGVTAGVPSVLSASLMAIDLDNDGSSELGMTIPGTYSTSGNNEVLFLAGGQCSTFSRWRRSQVGPLSMMMRMETHQVYPA